MLAMFKLCSLCMNSLMSFVLLRMIVTAQCFLPSSHLLHPPFMSRSIHNARCAELYFGMFSCADAFHALAHPWCNRLMRLIRMCTEQRYGIHRPSSTNTKNQQKITQSELRVVSGAQAGQLGKRQRQHSYPPPNILRAGVLIWAMGPPVAARDEDHRRRSNLQQMVHAFFSGHPNYIGQEVVIPFFLIVNKLAHSQTCAMKVESWYARDTIFFFEYPSSSTESVMLFTTASPEMAGGSWLMVRAVTLTYQEKSAE